MLPTIPPVIDAPGRLRITWVLPELNFSGGILANRLFADEMVRRGHDVTIVAPSLPFRSAPKAWQVRQRYRQTLANRRVSDRPTHHASGTLARLVMAPGRVITEADVPDADVIIATWWRTMEWIQPFGEAKGAKAYFIHGYETFGGPPARVENTYRLPARQIVVSPWLAERIRARFGFVNAALVPNGIDQSLFCSPPRERATPPTIGFISSNVPLKQSDVAMAAIERVRRDVPGVRALCFGTDAPPASLGNCTFHHRPTQAQTPELYRACDVWILPSTTEGFGLPGLEAMGCAVPIVATRCGGPEGYVRHGHNGYLTGVGEVEEIAARVRDILTCDPARWRAMSEAARTTAAGYRWDVSAHLLEDALRDAVRQRAGLFAQDPPAIYAVRADPTVSTDPAVIGTPPEAGEHHPRPTPGRYTRARMTGPRLRIHWILPEANLSGGIKSNRLIAEAMARRGHAVAMYLPEHTGKAWPKPWRVRQFAKRVRSEIEHLRAPSDHLMQSGVPIVRVPGSEVRGEHLPDADVVIGTWWRTMEWLRTFPPSKGRHAYFIRHHELFGGPVERVRQTYLQPSIKIVIARWLQDVMAKDYGDPTSILVPNGIDRSQFAAQTRGRNATPTIGFMYGGAVAWKDAPTAIEAIRLVQREVPGCRVVSFGSSPWMSEHAKPDNLDFTLKPEQSLIPKLYSRCDCWIMPSTSEGFGMPGIEAAACRCPIVSTRCGGPEDYVTDGVTGHLVPVGDARAMADAVLRVLRMDSHAWEAMSAASAARANEFDWDISARLLESGLYRALGIQPPPPLEVHPIPEAALEQQARASA